MARSFRESRFRGKRNIGEDVNPSAYIVNLADCMLVLACGFMVALISYWQIDVASVQKLDQERLKQVEPEEMPEDIADGGSYYIEAGTVYMDPNTGLYYIVTPTNEEGSALVPSEETAGANAQGATGSGSTSGSSGGSTMTDGQIRSARASGVD